MFAINIVKDIVTMGKLHIFNLVLYDVAFASARIRSVWMSPNAICYLSFLLK